MKFYWVRRDVLLNLTEISWVDPRSRGVCMSWGWAPQLTEEEFDLLLDALAAHMVNARPIK